MHRHIIICAAALGLASCQPATEDLPPKPVQWTRAPENSRVERMLPDELGLGSMTRCWPADGVWDCLYVIQNAYRGSISYTVQRATQNEPRPGYSWTDVSSAASIGYVCGFTIDHPGAYRASHLEETLNRGGNTLLTNTRYPDNPRIDSPPWTSELVTEFVAENGGDAGSTWFDCDHLARLAAQGSIETLTTTALKRSSL